MPNGEANADAKAALDHLTSAGVNAKLMDGERCVLASMRLQPAPFETLNGPMRIDQVIFASVGRYRIKCLKPQALFQLPLIRIHDCRDTTAIEARIRLVWKRHLGALDEARRWLGGLGVSGETGDGGASLSFPIEGENQPGHVRVLEPRRVAIPSAGPLSGVALQRADDRTLRIDRGVRSSVELEIAVSTRIDELLRLERRLGDERRRAALEQSEPVAVEAPTKRLRRILVVGPRLGRDRACAESLRLRGYAVDEATTEAEALAVLDRHSPELVLADMQMGRNDGTDLVLALRRVTGIEELPVVLVDETRRESSRDAAQRVGAAGYLVHPVEVPRIAAQIEKLISGPRRRRFTRYGRRLTVTLDRRDSPCTATTLGRGGMFVATDAPLSERTLETCTIALPEIDAAVACQAEVLYRRGSVGRSRGGYGVRFHSFDADSEHRLIEYLQAIDHASPAATAG